MANILDYLDWRGDLTLAQAPFNEVDNLILAELAFVDFRGIVPGVGEGKGIPLADAADAFFRKAQQQPELVDMGVLIPDSIPLLLEKMACSRRFGAMVLSCRAEHLDNEKAEQFAALAVELGEGTVYLAYRGTDDTLAGWKEDFLLACRPVIPAQKRALEYACLAAKQYPRKKLMLGGHSKGGNLAAYAASRLSPEERASLMEVWCNDSPGFCDDVVPLDTLRPICDRTRLYTPEYSVVGSLFDHVLAPTIIKSAGAGVMEHSAVEWQVMRGQFVRGEALRDGSERVNVAFNQLINSRDLPGRKKLLDDLYEGLTSQGIHTIGDMMSGDMAGLNATMSSINSLSPEDRQTMANFLWGIAGGTIGGAVAEAVAPVAKQLSEALADAAEAMQVRMRENASKALTRRQEAGEKVLTRRRGDEGEE